MIFINIKLSKTICIPVFLSFFFSYTKELFLLYTAVAIHEFTHLLAARFCSVECKEIKIDIFGMSLLCSPCDTPGKSVAIISAGPLVSFIMWYMCYLLPKTGYIPFFGFSNLCVFCVNIFPIPPLDGGRMIKIFLQSKWGIIRGSKMSKKLSGYIRAFFMSLWIISIIIKIFNPSAVIFIVFLVISEKREMDIMIFERNYVLGEYISKNRRLKYIASDSKNNFLEIAEKISCSYALVIGVFKDGRYIGEISETELLDAIKKIGLLCTLEEYFSYKIRLKNP